MKKLTIGAVILLMVGCASTPSMEKVESATNMDFDALVKEAKGNIDKAASIGYEWRDTRKILKKAQAAAKAGDIKKAVKLATLAKKQGELAYAQGQSQKDAGPWLF